MIRLFSIYGRIGRLEWWLMQLLSLAINIAGAFALIELFGEVAIETETLGISGYALLFAFFLTACWICTASTIKRYHDRGKSGLWILISLIPFGLIIVIVECGFFLARVIAIPTHAEAKCHLQRLRRTQTAAGKKYGLIVLRERVSASATIRLRNHECLQRGSTLPEDGSL